jgi:hypothetical protein
LYPLCNKKKKHLFPGFAQNILHGVQDRAHIFECADLLDNNDAHLQGLSHEDAEGQQDKEIISKINLRHKEKKYCKIYLVGVHLSLLGENITIRIETVKTT